MSEERDKTAPWIIGPYLVIHIIFLAYVGLLFWLSSDFRQFLCLPFSPFTCNPSEEIVFTEKFSLLRQLAIAASSAGVGGAVFMIREFYLSYAYGKRVNNSNNYLRNVEIPRYILLPFSSVVLGPISVLLLQSGGIVFSGAIPGQEIPDVTVVTVSFLFGFSYHDSLNALRNLSRKMLSPKKEDDQ